MAAKMLAGGPRKARTGARIAGLSLAIVLGAGSRAQADSGATPGRELFDQGRAYMEQHDYEKACAKFEDSYRVGPGGGTLLNLALCYELLGKTATAWATFKNALSAAVRDGRDDRRTLAETHIAALEPKLSRLQIRVPRTAETPGLVLRRNGIELGKSAWGEALAVDPGDQVIEAAAPGRRALRKVVTVDREGFTYTITLDPLLPAPPERQSAESSPRFWTGYRTAAVAGAGAGLIALGVGAYFGVSALNHNDRSHELCPSTERCDPAWLGENRTARSDATIATLLTVGGSVLLAGSAVVFFVAPSSGSTSAVAQGFTIGLRGEF